MIQCKSTNIVCLIHRSLITLLSNEFLPIRVTTGNRQHTGNRLIWEEFIYKGINYKGSIIGEPQKRHPGLVVAWLWPFLCHSKWGRQWLQESGRRESNREETQRNKYPSALSSLSLIFFTRALHWRNLSEDRGKGSHIGQPPGVENRVKKGGKWI